MGLDYLILTVNMLLVGTSFLFSYIFHRTLVSPLTVYAIFFIFLSNLNLVTSIDEAHLIVSGWWPIWTGAGSFILGYLTRCAFSPKVNNLNTYARRIKLDIKLRDIVDSANYLKMVLLLSVVVLFVSLTNLGRVISIYGLDFLSIGRMYEIEFAAYTPLNYLYFLVLLNIALSTLGGHFHSGSANLFRLLSIVAMVETLLIGQKSTFIFGLFIFIYTKLLILLKVSKAYVILAIVSICAVFLAIYLLREGSEGRGSNDLFAYLRSGIESYIVYNYKNLENIVTLDVVGAFEFPLQGHFERLIRILTGDFKGVVVTSTGADAPDFLINPGYNVLTYLGSLYLTYGGYFGIIGGSYAIGFVAAMLYLRLYSRPTLFVFFVNVIYFCMLTVTFSAFEFLRAQFLYLIVVSFIVDLFVKSDRTTKSLPASNGLALIGKN